MAKREDLKVGDKVSWDGSGDHTQPRIYRGTVAEILDGYAIVIDDEWGARNGVAFPKLVKEPPYRVNRGDVLFYLEGIGSDVARSADPTRYSAEYHDRALPYQRALEPLRKAYTAARDAQDTAEAARALRKVVDTLPGPESYRLRRVIEMLENRAPTRCPHGNRWHTDCDGCSEDIRKAVREDLAKHPPRK